MNVAAYRILREESPHEIEAELRGLETRVRRCLMLLDHKTRRPGEFRKRLDDLSSALAALSAQARDYLRLRNVELATKIPDGWQSTTNVPNLVVNPICFLCLEDQIRALNELWGALDGPVARRNRRGRPPVKTERALYHFVAAAYIFASGRAASDTSNKFMAVCDKIKLMYGLNDWRPDSLARSARSRERIVSPAVV